MNIVRALIAEDEPVLAFTLQKTLQKIWPELQIGGVATNGISAVQEALAQRPDVLFLDIKMPGKSGIEAAQELAEEWPEETPFPLVVFITAYDEFAVQAFEQSAADYVLKPANEARLTKTVERLKTRLHQHDERNAELERIVGQLRTLVPTRQMETSAAERLTVIRAAVGNQVRLIQVADVAYLEASDKYVNVVTADSESLIRLSLKELLPQLDPAQFWQIHRGTVVNIGHVHAAVREESGKLLLKLRSRTEQLSVSRVFAHLFKQM